MWKALRNLFVPPTPAVRRFPPAPKLILTGACMDAVQAGLVPEIQGGREGIVYLLGRTDGQITLGIGVFRPQARTTAGSFHVSALAMAQCVDTAATYELQVIGQLHTHPGQAYHSDGDIEGTRIRYVGFVSLVAPNYGRQLPSLSGIAAYMWRHEARWHELPTSDLVILQGAGPWTVSNGSTGGTAARSGTAVVA